MVDDLSKLDIEIDDNLAAWQIIQELIDRQFLAPWVESTREYMLTVEGDKTIAAGMTLISDTNGERYLHQIRPVCLQQGPIDGIFKQDIDILVNSLFAWAIEFAGLLLTCY